MELQDLPQQFQWIDLSNRAFTDALDTCVNSDKNLFLNAKAGTGKTTIIKILSQMVKNCVVLSTTGITAVELSAENVAAKTIHSFFSIPPFQVFKDDDLFSMGPKNHKLLNTAELIIIDEVSMMSASVFDFMCNKIQKWRKDHQIPRMILFGDIMQLPPVIDQNDKVNYDFFQQHYNGNIMFFNSEWYKDLGFKLLHLYKSYRQADQEFSDHLKEIGFNEHTQETLDYFNQRVMTLPAFEKLHKNFIYMTPTNSLVNNMNNKYIKTLTGTPMIYEADMSHNFPQDKKLNSDKVEVRVGAQIMCLVNNYEDNYVNGTIGEVIEVHKDHLVIEHDNKLKRVRKTKYDIFEQVIDSKGNLERKSIGWYRQIDCKVCRASTIHKMQGKSLDAGYMCLQGWVPEGLVYVGLSRLRTLDGLGLNRPLTSSDIKVNEESRRFLEDPE